MAFPLILLLLAGGETMREFRQEPLSASEKSVVRPRVDRFASRYSPEMSDRERSGIVDDVRWTQIVGTHFLFEQVGFQTLLLLGFVGYLLWYRWSSQRLLKKQGMAPPSNERVMMLAGTVATLVVAWCLISSSISNWEMVRAGEAARPWVLGATEEGKIVLAKNNRFLLRDIDHLTGVFDHELTHLFGQWKYQKIRRDGWLSYAYPAVLALERGGFPGLQNEESGDRKSKKERMSWYTAGVMCTKETAPTADPEAVFIKKLGLKESINPDAPVDWGSGVPGIKANLAFDYGVAGIAWYLSAGNGDIALSYLDDRSNGIPPLEARERALERVRLAEKEHSGSAQLRTTELLNEAMLYRGKLGREEAEGDTIAMFSQTAIPIQEAFVGFLVALGILGLLFWKWRFQGRKNRYPPSRQHSLAWAFGLACCIISCVLSFWLLSHVPHYLDAYTAMGRQILNRLLFAHKHWDSFFNFLLGAVLGPTFLAPILFLFWLVSDGVYLVSFRAAYKETCARYGTPEHPPGD